MSGYELIWLCYAVVHGTLAFPVDCARVEHTLPVTVMPDGVHEVA
jgi:hypothetical protein